MSIKNEAELIKNGSVTLESFVKSRYTGGVINIMLIAELYKKAKDPSYQISTKIQDEYLVTINSLSKQMGFVDQSGNMDPQIRDGLLKIIVGNDIGDMKLVNYPGAKIFLAVIIEKMKEMHNAVYQEYRTEVIMSAQQRAGDEAFKDFIGKNECSNDWYMNYHDENGNKCSGDSFNQNDTQ